jgi:hypothetical protein
METYKALQLLRLSNDDPRPYINPNCVEIDQSTFYCDMVGEDPSVEAPCAPGGHAQPLGKTAPLNPGLDKLKAWIQCGAPNN